MGLLYLHSHDPPIIHRDLKCDNIFINGNQGEVKIGDLGLAAILRRSHAVHCVGTPEFMAPEVYEEEYNELVDIYSFGMCVLEMVTFEYPYSECTHPAQIYKKVISGAKPDALYIVKDPEVRQFIEKCLATASQRLSARELLMDPFLQTDGLGSGCCGAEVIDLGPISRQPSYSSHNGNSYLIANGSSDDLQHESELDYGWEDNSADYEKHGIDLFNSDEEGSEYEPITDVDITIKGRKGDDGGIFIRLRIGDKEGRARNIYFPFDIDTDTALGVAAEMIDELDITDHEVTRIADMIDGEVSSLVPEWKAQMGVDEASSFPATSCCHNCESNASSCGSHIGCCEIHGRFEEITYQTEASEQSLTEGAPVLSSSQSDGLEITSQGSVESNFNEDCSLLSGRARKKAALSHMDNESHNGRKGEDYGDMSHADPKWLKLLHHTKVKDFRNRLLGRKAMNLSLDLDKERIVGEGFKAPRQMKSFHLGRRFSFQRPDVDTEHVPGDQPTVGAQRVPDQETSPNIALEKTFAVKSYYIGDSLPTSLPRARSLCI